MKESLLAYFAIDLTLTLIVAAFAAAYPQTRDQLLAAILRFFGAKSGLYVNIPRTIDDDMYAEPNLRAVDDGVAYDLTEEEILAMEAEEEARKEYENY